jgi:predicted nucleic acid-binding protein
VSVALDTMVMIWGIKQVAPAHSSPRVADMQRRASILLSELEEDEATIIVPNIVVAELLLAVPSADHGKFVAELQNRFFMPTFDLRATVVAASLWQAHRKLPPGEQIERTTLKSDVMIIATAKVAGATKFYSNDDKARKLANLARLDGVDLPLRSRDLFPPSPPATQP